MVKKTENARVEQVKAEYAVARWYINFFKSVMKLQAKRRVSSQVKKAYNASETPYQPSDEGETLSPAAFSPIIIRESTNQYPNILDKSIHGPTWGLQISMI